MTTRPFPLTNAIAAWTVELRRPASILRLALLVIGCAITTPMAAIADEIDDVFNHPKPALYEQQPVRACSPLRLIAGEAEETLPPVAESDLNDSPPSQHFDFEQTFAPNCCFDFESDLRGFLPTLRDDARGVVNWNNAAILGGALATSVAFRQSLDDRVRRNTARHPERWGEGSKTLGQIGEVQYHVAAMAVLYGMSLKRQDDTLHEFTSTLISAYTINGLSTLTIKGIANTERPSDEWNGGDFGFPSFHASSSFTIAAVVDEYYGPKAGLPAYALAGLISWSRIDERDHDLSDVVFGAAMGYVIGHAVAGRHLRCDSRVKLLPYIHPTEGTSGLMVDVSF